ncbi:hypothetical protein DYB30_003116 [Aphanomyces astaci]|uniref:Guanylate cyclase domain-containing protein n=1 Tax=Aphanomyces astaci TaxID=112090 RepID=A0A397E8T6_APHAT|nr:hypothetical protein DYB30_003116 [Aphanomyces astaci]
MAIVELPQGLKAHAAKKNLERLLSVAPEADRVFFVHDRSRTREHCTGHCQPPYPTNVMRTSKYSVLTFVPHNLLEQFRRVANVYFLVISVLQLTTSSLSPTNTYSTVLPFVIVLAVTMVKDAIEDRRRYVADATVNLLTTHRLVRSSFEVVTWQSLEVGDIVRVMDGDSVPADLLLVVSGESSTEDNAADASQSSAYVDTSGLDGAAHPKLKQCLDNTSSSTTMSLEPYHGRQICCDAPNPSLLVMGGSITNGSGTIEDATKFTIDNVLLRGTMLCRTKWVVGIVLATGHDTKLLQHCQRPMAKFSQIDRVANRCIGALIGVLVVLVTASAAAGQGFLQQPAHVVVTFGLENEPGMQFGSLWITYLILYSHLVPISLYITLDVVKWFQVKQIERDTSMACPVTGRLATANTANLNEDLGQVNRTLARCVLLCHAATYYDQRLYSSSPDEMALLAGFSRLHCAFQGRNGNVVTISIFGDVETYLVLACNPFDSIRRCMSVLVQRQGEAQHVLQFACAGLRTLVFASRRITGDEFTSIGKVAISQDRDALVQALEGPSMAILGATGIEDRIQTGVPNCIGMLRQAGLRIWMVTGDKDETAVATASACGLYTTGCAPPAAAASQCQPFLQHHQSLLLSVDGTSVDECLDQITQHRRALKKQGLWNPATVIPTLVVVLHGLALDTIVAANYEVPTDLLLELLVQASIVVACRVTPAQKATLVRLVQTYDPGNVTLAVGDGGNDVPMLQTAHIGVGLYGREGYQTVRAADFAIAEFRFLSSLLLLHGRWNHRRIMHVLLFTLYKNLVLVATVGLFSFFTGFSGQTLIDSSLIVGWNVLFTIAPMFVFGIVDQDITATTVLHFPAIYQEMEPLHARKFLLWAASAVLHSSIILYIMTTSVRGSPSEQGGVFYLGTIVFGATLLSITVKAAMTMHRWHRWQCVHVASLAVGPVLFAVVVWVCSNLYILWPHLQVARDFAGLGTALISHWPSVTLLILVAVSASILPDVAFIVFQRLYYYSNRHVLQEIDSHLSASHRRSDKPQIVAPCPDTPAASLVVTDPLSDSCGGRSSPQSPAPTPVPTGDIPMSTAPPSSECAILIAQLQRLHATHRADPEDNLLAATDTKMHPTKMAFVGKQRVALESEFDASVVRQERHRVRFYVYVATSLMLASVLLEYFVRPATTFPNFPRVPSPPLVHSEAPPRRPSVRQPDARQEHAMTTSFLVSRLIIVVLALAYAQFTRTSTFSKHYHIAIMVPLAVTGVVVSATITVTGYVSAVLFPIVVLTMLHVQFTAALLLVLGNFAVYVVLQMLFSAGLSPIELGAFTCYIALVVGLAAHGCWRRQYAMRVDFLQHRALAIEEFRAMDMLRSMFPPHVMAKLKAGDAVISEQEPHVTVLFCDVVDLHAFMHDHAPAEVVALLDHIYSLFDEMCGRFGVQKMETVGKTYMACAGMQSDGVDGGQLAALRAACLAQEMLRLMATCRTPRGTTIPLRIGLHSGRVLSGLVGRKKQQFSLFGDTVNTASRMQSTGLIGAVQVSEATHLHLKSSFSFESRHVDVKGKGPMTTYLLGEPVSDAARQLLRPRPAKPAPAAATAGDRHDVAMAANVHPTWLHFTEPSMEAAFVAATSAARDTTAMYVLYALGLYMGGFALVRDIVLGVDDNRITSDLLVFSVVSRLTMVAATAGVLRWRPAMVLSRTCLVACLCITILASYHIWAVQTCGADRQGDMLALDVVWVMFAVSNSGALVHRAAIGFNVAAWAVSIPVFVLSYTRQGTSDCMYPIILTSCAAIANVTTSRRIEFFNRRVLWLQQRTQLETTKADELLYQRLPQAVVRRMKQGDVVCDEHVNVGILYSDIKGYTSIASKANTEQVIHMLDTTFASFDTLTDKHNVFKLQTIGDAYVVVSGLPYVDAAMPDAGKDGIPKLLRQDTNADAAVCEIQRDQARQQTTTNAPCMRVDLHLQNLLHMALDMIHQVAKVHDPNTNEPLQMRIGIHLGRIYGGVIGNTTLRYDMWGPDVLTANEVESNGVAGKVVVTDAVKAELEALGIECHYHCDIKANVKTYVVQLEPGHDLPRSDSPRRATSTVGSGGTSPAKLRKSY